MEKRSTGANIVSKSGRFGETHKMHFSSDKTGLKKTFDHFEVTNSHFQLFKLFAVFFDSEVFFQ